MQIHRRAFGAAALGIGAGLTAQARESESFEEDVAVQRMYDADGQLIAVDAQLSATEEWAPLLRRD